MRKSFYQIEGIEYIKTFTNIIKFITRKLLFILKAKYNCEIEQFDIITVFLELLIKKPYVLNNLIVIGST